MTPPLDLEQLERRKKAGTGKTVAANIRNGANELLMPWRRPESLLAHAPSPRRSATLLAVRLVCGNFGYADASKPAP